MLTRLTVILAVWGYCVPNTTFRVILHYSVRLTVDLFMRSLFLGSNSQNSAILHLFQL